MVQTNRDISHSKIPLLYHSGFKYLVCEVRDRLCVSFWEDTHCLCQWRQRCVTMSLTTKGFLGFWVRRHHGILKSEMSLYWGCTGLPCMVHHFQIAISFQSVGRHFGTRSRYRRFPKNVLYQWVLKSVRRRLERPESRRNFKREYPVNFLYSTRLWTGNGITLDIMLDITGTNSPQTAW